MPPLPAFFRNALLLVIAAAAAWLGVRLNLFEMVYFGSRGSWDWAFDGLLALGLAALLTFPLYALRRHQLATALITAKSKATADVARALRLDALTGLGNRQALADMLPLHDDTGDTWALVLVDIDNFRAVNDLRGHDVGDQVLIEVAKRLTAVTGPAARPYRLAGDEYAMLHHPAADVRLPEDLADDAIAALEKPIQIGNFTLHISASCGIALFGAGTTLSEASRRAGLALSEARRLGPGNLRVFDQKLDQRLRKAAILEEDLLHAVTAGHLQCVFQPYFDLETGEILGAEALARWQHPRLGYVPPERFIVLADKMGIIDRLSDLILDQACQAAQDWPADMTLSFNISPTQFSDATLAARITRTLQRYGIPGDRVEVEVTEHAVVSDYARAAEIMQALSQAGIRLALDDFGTGMSSLSLLTDYPFQKLKIDRSFVANLHDDPMRATIATGVAGMAHALGLDVTAEGIERPEEHAFLCNHLPMIGQGFLLGRPQSAEDVLKLMISNQTSIVTHATRRGEARSGPHGGGEANPPQTVLRARGGI